MKPFLVLQLRPEDEASDGEFQAFLEKGGLDASRAHRVRLEHEDLPSDLSLEAYAGVIVGGGPAGLSAAIKLKQINDELEVVVLEKGSEIGAHILSGAVVDPKALSELFPDWRDMDCPMAETPVTDNWHWALTKNGKWDMPHLMMPPFMTDTDVK